MTAFVTIPTGEPRLYIRHVAEGGQFPCNPQKNKKKKTVHPIYSKHPFVFVEGELSTLC